MRPTKSVMIKSVAEFTAVWIDGAAVVQIWPLNQGLEPLWSGARYVMYYCWHLVREHGDMYLGHTNIWAQTPLGREQLIGIGSVVAGRRSKAEKSLFQHRGKLDAAPVMPFGSYDLHPDGQPASTHAHRCQGCRQMSR